MSRTGSAAFVLVCVLASALPARDVPLPPTASLTDWAKKAQGRYAYGLYITGKKVGWMIEELKPGKHDGKDVLKSLSESYMATTFDGEKSVKEEKSVISYELTGEGRIVHAEVWKKEDGKEVTRVAVPRGRCLRITTKQGGRTLTRDVTLPKDTLAEQRKLEAWLAGMRKAGEKLTTWSVSWDETDVDQKRVHTFKERKTILWGGVKTAVVAVEVDMDGAKLKADVLQDGRLVTGVIGGLMNLRLEKEAIARKLGPVVDLLEASAIIIDRDLGRARNVDALTLEVTGLGDFKIPVSHRQIVKTGKESTTLEIRRDFQLEKGRALTKEERSRWTKTTPRLQCDHATIREKARKIVGGETDPLKAAKKIEAWIRRTLKESYSDNADTALEVLDRMAGACQEHSLLFVSLARAAGIPAREVGGIAYTKVDKPLFAWHAWAEFHDGRQWVTVDPTWHQVYVDGTHIKLSEGSRDMTWANLVGKLKIKVVTAATRK
jgi:hypothetical protein